MKKKASGEVKNDEENHEKIMSYMLITAVLITNLALVPVAASQEDATEEGKQQEASGEPGDTSDSGKVPAAKRRSDG